MNVRDENENTYSREELLVMIEKMKKASGAFYLAAAATGNHAFIEFTGFMNEYIKWCEQAVEEGHDFTQANVHCGKPLRTLEDFEASYLGEKFGCIFSTTFQGNKGLIDSFVASAFEGDRTKIQTY